MVGGYWWFVNLRRLLRKTSKPSLTTNQPSTDWSWSSIFLVCLFPLQKKVLSNQNKDQFGFYIKEMEAQKKPEISGAPSCGGGNLQCGDQCLWKQRGVDAGAGMKGWNWNWNMIFGKRCLFQGYQIHFWGFIVLCKISRGHIFGILGS